MFSIKNQIEAFKTNHSASALASRVLLASLLITTDDFVEDFEDCKVEDYDVEDYEVEDYEVEDYKVEDCKVEDYEVEDYEVEDYEADYKVEKSFIQQLRDRKATLNPEVLALTERVLQSIAEGPEELIGECLPPRLYTTLKKRAATKEDSTPSIRVAALILHKEGRPSEFYFYARQKDKTGSGIFKATTKELEEYAQLVNVSRRQAYQHFKVFREKYCYKAFKKEGVWHCFYFALYRLADTLGLDTLGPIADVPYTDLNEYRKALPAWLIGLEGQRQSQYKAALAELKANGGLELTAKKRTRKGFKVSKVVNSDLLFAEWIKAYDDKSKVAQTLNNHDAVLIMEAGDRDDSQEQPLHYFCSPDGLYHLSKYKPVYGVTQTTIGRRMGDLTQPQVSKLLSKCPRLHQYMKVSEREAFGASSIKEGEHYFSLFHNGRKYHFKQVADLFYCPFTLLGCRRQRQALKRCRRLYTERNLVRPSVLRQSLPRPGTSQ